MPTKDACVDENVLNNVPYLKACVTETFRICPTACNLARMLDTDIQLGDYKIPAYVRVYYLYVLYMYFTFFRFLFLNASFYF